MDTLACAYARNDQFDQAVKTQEKAHKLAKQAGFKKKHFRALNGA
jgi:hypothetical protein